VEETNASEKCGLGKNFIGLLHEETGKQRLIAAMQTSMGGPIRQYVFRPTSPIFDRRGEAK
jgi:hypothetical protein